MQLRVHTAIEVDAAPERAFDFAAANATLARMLQPLGPIPGVTSIEMLDGAALVSGARRRVRMTDGSELEEQVLDYDRPRRHRYQWLHAPAGPFGLLIRRAEGDWLFSASAHGTRIEWTYTFDLSSPFAAPLALPVLAIFKRWMQRALDRIAVALHG